MKKTVPALALAVLLAFLAGCKAQAAATAPNSEPQTAGQEPASSARPAAAAQREALPEPAPPSAEEQPAEGGGGNSARPAHKDSSDGPPSAESQYWRVTVNDVQSSAGLSGTIDMVQYDGSISQSAVNAAPKDGCAFLLLFLTIEKTQGGKALFSWKDTYILDESGGKYQRHENDTFLDNVGYSPRLKATDQALGAETGWACYEVSAGAGALYLVHDGGDGEIRISIGEVR
ncbi:MAG: hypothetical protein LBS62_09670 [Clostridiales bacterium]|jgi:hypothetical protein|nr:hypothetical protein [Clostridiales bacterium]